MNNICFFRLFHMYNLDQLHNIIVKTKFNKFHTKFISLFILFGFTLDLTTVQVSNKSPKFCQFPYSSTVLLRNPILQKQSAFESLLPTNTKPKKFKFIRKNNIKQFTFIVSLTPEQNFPESVAISVKKEVTNCFSWTNLTFCRHSWDNSIA